MGSCPVYDIAIYPNGKVTLNAKKFLEIKGDFESKLSKDELNSLLETFESSNFTSFKKSYTSNMSDLPTTKLSYTVSNKTHKVVNYDGAPQALKDLQRLVAELVDQLDWKRVEQ